MTDTTHTPAVDIIVNPVNVEDALEALRTAGVSTHPALHIDGVIPGRQGTTIVTRGVDAYALAGILNTDLIPAVTIKAIR